ncbi:MAG TPA: hypothetical protein PLN52_00770 [Opitutaceae bacterium]|nr:hypothetical protein [Opitutaceae bacterium]
MKIVRHVLLVGFVACMVVGCASRPEGISRENWGRLSYREKLKATNRDASSWPGSWTTGLYDGLNSRNLEQQEGNLRTPH